MLYILPRDQHDRFPYWKEELILVIDRLFLDPQVYGPERYGMVWDIDPRAHTRVWYGIEV